MEQVKIGKFIAELRKQQGLTQAQLGEMLGVTNKTVSRWENGNYMPEISLIPDLADKLGISINELMAGERFTEHEYRRGADEQLLKNMQLLEEILGFHRAWEKLACLLWARFILRFGFMLLAGSTRPKLFMPVRRFLWR